LAIHNIEAKPLPVQTKVTTIIADNELSLVIELNEDNKQNSNEAIGLTTYSKSESTVLSYVSIFEILWLSSTGLHRMGS
jgi:two-component system, OmpR family, sensor histidine kinase VicK